MMKASDKAISIIKHFEGCQLTAYRCPAGKWTIGYGHTTTVYDGMTITKTEAEQLLRDDLQSIENYINRLAIVLTQCQYDALVSFVFNVGIGNLQKSSLLKMIKHNPNNKQIADEFDKWIYSAGRSMKGLKERRKAEAQLYLS